MLKLVQILMFSIFMTGCAYTFTYSPRPDTFKLDPILEFSSPGEISIINVQNDNVDRVHITNMGSKFLGNKKSWTDTAVEITKRELIAREATIVKNGNK